MTGSAAAPIALRPRLQAAARTLEYLIISLPLGIVGALFMAALGLGALLSLAWVGLPLVLAVVVACGWLAGADRRQANRLLDAHIAPLPPRRTRRSVGTWRRTMDALGDAQNRRLLLHALTKLPLTLAVLAAGLAPIFLAAGLITLGVQGIGGLGTTEYVGPLALNPLSGVLCLLLVVPAAVVAVAVLGGFGTVLRNVAQALLSPHKMEAGPVREMLAESLGDRTLSVAYWLPDREIFVDEAGHPVVLPEPESGRAWTAVERDGRRVAAIIHDAELDTGPELVNAAAAGAELAIDNERLKADLRARVEELRLSRVRLVEAGDEARRRLERDLHDGAQQQLVSLSLDLRLLQAKLKGTDLHPVVGEISEKLGVALSELRELARGIHPAILTDRGIGPAVESLAQRSPVPVETDVAVQQRLTPAIEAAAYFVVAEALTNVAKYANARSVLVEVHHRGEELHVEVADDGVGGANFERGSGLRGLIDRLGALDGTLELHSPPGGGTRLTARIPCEAGSLVADATEGREVRL